MNEKPTLIMKIENISMVKEVWDWLDKMDKSISDTERDVALGTLIMVGISKYHEDMENGFNSNGEEFVYKKTV